ncbi:MAG: YjjG family noncanonical pyrimidine nucleotidase [Clostridia bacterium]|nr:YjjG family noncanonical pyrimidine nucleotidase [Clostridia bacterium]
MKYDIFLVDADDTLLDFHASALLAIKKSFERFGYEWEERFGETFTNLNARLWASLERKEITRKQLTEDRFPLYLSLLGICDISGEEYNRRFLQLLSTLPIYISGAEEFLTALQSAGRVYIVTNGTEWIQKSRFDIAGLWSYADGVFVSDTVGADKPSKAYTDHVIAHIPDFNRERTVWIGDSLSADIRAANDANIDSIWFNPKRKSRKDGVTATYEAESFEEILQILQIKAKK